MLCWEGLVTPSDSNLLIPLQSWLVGITEKWRRDTNGRIALSSARLTTCNSNLAYRQIFRSRHQIALAFWLTLSHSFLYSTLREDPKHIKKKTILKVWKFLIEAQRESESSFCICWPRHVFNLFLVVTELLERSYHILIWKCRPHKKLMMKLLNFHSSNIIFINAINI